MPDIIVEHRNERGMGAGMILGILAVGVAVILALFFVFGGPSRFMGSGAPGQTNVNINQQPAAVAATAQPAAAAATAQPAAVAATAQPAAAAATAQPAAVAATAQPGGSR